MSPAREKTAPVPEDGSLFLDLPDLGGALGLAVRIDRVLEHRRSAYQDIYAIEAGELGRGLVLDRCIQTTLFDEAGYHEMLAHVPLLTHPHPRRVLVIGGGDGGTLREVLKHPTVEKADLCEIDGEVIEVCRRHLPELAASLDDPRVEIFVEDGAEFMAGRENLYDVILVDSSDPEGPAGVLYTPEFYASLKKALKPGGLIASQAESFYIYPEILKHLMGFLPGLFPRVHYYLTLVPTYNTGVIGFALCSTGPDPLAGPDPSRAAALTGLRHYTPELHRGAFALPKRCLDIIAEAWGKA